MTNIDEQNYTPAFYHRQSIRLKGYDYSLAGAYFITICCQDKMSFFGDIAGEQILLNDIGHMVQASWERLPYRFPHLDLDASVVMPNHFHAILLIASQLASAPGAVANVAALPTTSTSSNPNAARGSKAARAMLGDIVGAFKSITTHEYTLGVSKYGWPLFPGRLWQRNYYEHIIRSEKELNRTRRYVSDNPARWADDGYYSNREE
jgi:putative transposase